MNQQPIEGLAFLLNDSVRVVSGSHQGKCGTVVALDQIEPAVTYVIKLSDSGDVRIAEADLLTANADDAGQAVDQLQRWYSSQCDGDWEHQLGIKIETLDNPGWMVTVDLNDTPLQSAPFTAIENTDVEREWISCRVEQRQFRGAGGPHMLSAIIEIFVRWAGARRG
ncbi:MAG: hypothetical protein F6K19_40765 [Cyanothece sp. SIO1E1]|nr:hypothetical protein [Cyanothece sp. SIO1E1]